MNEPRKAGRPKKHLANEHHFQTSDDASAAGAPPAAADSGQADASDEALASDSASAELYSVDNEAVEAVVVNPTISPTHDIFSSLETAPQKLESAEQEIAAKTLQQESPIEQKIHVLMEDQQERMKTELTQFLYADDPVELNGWYPIETDTVLNSPPRNGMAVRLSKTTDGEFVVGYWKRSRAFANATKRWQETGYWLDFHTGVKIDFEPKYWKERF